VPSCLGVAKEYGLPIHLVVINNGRYRSVETSLTKYFPDGTAKITVIPPTAPRSALTPITNIAAKPTALRLPRRPAERELTEIDVVLSDCNPWQIFGPRIEM
jgi:hypothetical protein